MPEHFDLLALDLDRGQTLLQEHAGELREEPRRAILCDKVADLDGSDVAALRATSWAEETWKTT